MGWEDKPSSIDNLEGVDCFFAIDENGTSSLKNAQYFSEDNTFFTVTGIYIDLENHNFIKQQIVDLKNEFWEDGFFKGKRVLLHSKDIRKRQGAFNPKLINYEKFTFTLDELLSSLPIKAYSASIDKKAHWSKYVTPYPVYELGVEFLIERFCFELRRRGKKGVVLLESRGYKEDCLVLDKMKRLLNHGNNYNCEDNFSGIQGVYFNHKRTNDGLMSYWPLELSDLFSYRIHRFVKTGEVDERFDCIKEKIFGYPFFKGKGLKVFPAESYRGE